MRLLTIVGARPQFIKAAPVSLAIQRLKGAGCRIENVIIHTGQHYDENMSDIFFRQLSIPEPAYNLQAGSGSHAEQTGLMLRKLEEAMVVEKPDMILVYGDTNSTLAGALTASKLNIPLAHVEAGLRSYNRRMPEEINRIVTDRLSDLLFCSTPNAVNLLQSEGITRNVFITGDVMYDAALIFSDLAKKHSRILESLELQPDSYLLATIHRAENTDDTRILKNIFAGLSRIPHTIVLPAHPRLRVKIKEHGLHEIPAHIRLVEPVSFLDMIWLEQNARMVLTDSGGVQKEAYFYKRPCITMRNETEWVETLENGCNVLTGSDPEKIQKAAERKTTPDMYQNIFGDGNAGDAIIQGILKFFR